MVSTWVGDHHGIPCAVRPFSLSFNMAGSLAHTVPRRGSDPRDLERSHKSTHKALGLCLAQRPGAFFLASHLFVQLSHLFVQLKTRPAKHTHTHTQRNNTQGPRSLAHATTHTSNNANTKALGLCPCRDRGPFFLNASHHKTQGPRTLSSEETLPVSGSICSTSASSSAVRRPRRGWACLRKWDERGERCAPTPKKNSF